MGEGYLRDILDSVSEGFWVVDRSGMITDTNRPMCAILGLPREEIIGKKAGHFLNRRRAEMLTPGPIDPNQDTEYEIRLKNASDEGVICIFRFSNTFTQSGAPNGFIAIATNITDRKKEREELDTFQMLLEDVLESPHNYSAETAETKEPDEPEPGIPRGHHTQRLEQERSRLRLAVAILSRREDFSDLMERYERFFDEGVYDVINDSMPDLRAALVRIIVEFYHFRRSFSRYHMMHTAGNLRDLENIMYDMLTDDDHLSRDDLFIQLESAKSGQWAHEDLETLRDMVDMPLRTFEPKVPVARATIIALEKKLLSLGITDEVKQLFAELRLLRCVPFRSLLDYIPQYVRDIAEVHGKRIKPVIIKGGDIPVDAAIYRAFTRGLAHVFENAVEHGIEAAGVRVLAGKCEEGAIRCEVTFPNNSHIRVAVGDDGAGINTEALRANVIKHVTDDTPKPPSSERNMLNYVFVDRVTTRTDIESSSHAGLGLSTVRRVIESLGGTVTVRSTSGVGTEFTFTIPYTFKEPLQAD